MPIKLEIAIAYIKTHVRGIIGMQKTRTYSSLKRSVKIIVSTVLLINFFTASRVILQSFAGGYFEE